MEKKILCPKCGLEMDTKTALGTLCPKCLMGAAKGLLGDENTVELEGDFDENHDFSIEAIRKFFPNLEIMELIGRGGMGSVYKARQPSLDRMVALKVIHPSIAKSPEFVERFKREAQTLAKLNHSNIVTVHDFGIAGNLCFLIMEYMDGVNLRQAIRQAKLKPNEVLEIVMRICDALQFAHEEGVVHRDIKPENILLDLKNQVKIVDFGLAKLVADKSEGLSLTEVGKSMGTPDYMAPEQRREFKEVDQRADIYSLGVVFYEMLTGQLPMGRFAPPSQKAQIDVRVDEVVLRSLENEPEMRYQKASQVRKDVETIVTNSDSPSNAERDSNERVNIKQDIGKTLAQLGAILSLGLPFGFFNALFCMAKNVNDWIALGGVEMQPPETFVENLSIAIDNSFIGVSIGVVGLILIWISMYYAKYRASWFYYWVSSLCFFLLLLFPIGTVVGITLMVYLNRNKKEFFNVKEIKKSASSIDELSGRFPSMYQVGFGIAIFIASFLPWGKLPIRSGITRLIAGNYDKATHNFIIINGWNGYIKLFGISSPNWLVGIMALAIISITLFQRNAKQKISPYIATAFAAYGTFHCGFIFTTLFTYDRNYDIGIILSLGFFVILLGITIFESYRSYSKIIIALLLIATLILTARFFASTSSYWLSSDSNRSQKTKPIRQGRKKIIGSPTFIDMLTKPAKKSQINNRKPTFRNLFGGKGQKKAPKDGKEKK